jgi:hypothetical protein
VTDAGPPTRSAPPAGAAALLPEQYRAGIPRQRIAGALGRSPDAVAARRHPCPDTAGAARPRPPTRHPAATHPPAPEAAALDPADDQLLASRATLDPARLAVPLGRSEEPCAAGWWPLACARDANARPTTPSQRGRG